MTVKLTLRLMIFLSKNMPMIMQIYGDSNIVYKTNKSEFFYPKMERLKYLMNSAKKLFPFMSEQLLIQFANLAIRHNGKLVSPLIVKKKIFINLSYPK